MKQFARKCLAAVLSLFMLLQSMPVAFASSLISVMSNAESGASATHLVVFIGNNGEVVSTKLVEHGANAPKPDNADITWNVDDYTNITQDTTVYPVLPTSDFTFGVLLDGSFAPIKTVTAEVKNKEFSISTSDAPTKYQDGSLPATARNWKYGASTTQPSGSLTSNTRNTKWKGTTDKGYTGPFYAWPGPDTYLYYTVTFRWMDESGTEQLDTKIVQYTKTATAPTPQMSDGYRTVWPAEVATTQIKQKTSFTGEMQVRVLFVDDKGVKLAGESWQTMGQLAVPTQFNVPDGKTLTGWQVNGEGEIIPTDALANINVAEPLTFVAVLEESENYLSIQQNGMDVESITAKRVSVEGTVERFSPETIRLTAATSANKPEDATVAWSYPENSEIVQIAENGDSITVTPLKYADNASVTITAALMRGDETLATDTVTYVPTPGDMLKVTFDKNGGSGTAPQAYYAAAGSEITMPGSNGMSKTSRVFSGWSLNKNANNDSAYEKPEGTVYPEGATFRLSDDATKNITLYAIWSEVDKTADFFIRLDGKIPTEPQSHDSSEYTSGITISNALKEATFYTNSSSGVGHRLNHQPSTSQIQNVLSTYNPDTHYVLWYVIKAEGTWHVDGVLLEKAKVNLNYDANAPTWQNMPDGQQYTVGTEATVSDKIPTRVGYTFTGWNTTADGKGASYQPNATFTIKKNTTLYAQWMPNDRTAYKVKFFYADAQGNYPDDTQLISNRHGQTDANVEVTDADKNPTDPGYTFDATAPNVLTGTIAADGSTVLKVHFKRRTDLSYTVNYYLNHTTQTVATPKVVDSQTFDTEVTEQPIPIDGYTPVNPEEVQTLTISGTETKNVINFYYYQNVTLTANSGEAKYDGTEKTVSGFTGAPDDADFANITVSASGTDAGTYPAAFADGTVGTKDLSGKYIVTATTNGKLTVTKSVVRVDINNKIVDYNGQPQTVADANGKLYQVTGLADGHTLELDIHYSSAAMNYNGGAPTEAATYKVDPNKNGLEYSIKDQAGNDVTKNYFVTNIEQGELIILPVYQVRYYKDSVAEGNLIGMTEGYLSLKGATQVTLDSSTLDAYRPNGYLTGVQQNTTPQFDSTNQNVRVINVLYSPSEYAYTIRFLELVDGQPGKELQPAITDQRAPLGTTVDAGEYESTEIKGFEYNKNASTTFTIVSSDPAKNVITLYYTRNTYTVTYKFEGLAPDVLTKADGHTPYYDVNGTVWNGKTDLPFTDIPYEAEHGVMATPYAAGYEFNGWQPNVPVTIVDGKFTVDQDVTFVGTWTEKQVKINYKVLQQGGGTAGKVTVGGQTGYNLSETINITGTPGGAKAILTDHQNSHLFVGWYIGEPSEIDVTQAPFTTDASFIPSKDDGNYTAWDAERTYTAYFKPISVKVRYYLESISDSTYLGEASMTAGGVYQNTQRIVEGTRIVLQSGHAAGDLDYGKYTGQWRDWNNAYVGVQQNYFEIQLVPEDQIINVVYYKRAQTLTIEHRDKDDPTKLLGTENRSVTFGQSYTAEGFKKDFAGYEYDSADRETITIENGANTLILYYQQKPQYTVSYKYTGTVMPEGLVVPDLFMYRAGDTVKVADAPNVDATKYQFNGWVPVSGLDPSAIDPDGNFTMPEGNVEFEGSFTQLGHVRIEYYVQSAAPGGPYNNKDDIHFEPTDFVLDPGTVQELDLPVKSPVGTDPGSVYDLQAHYTSLGYNDYFIAGESIHNGHVPEDGTTLVLKRYYKLQDNILQYSYYYNSEIKDNDLLPALKRYQTGYEVTLAEPLDVPGYSFDGWYHNNVLLTESTFTMPNAWTNLQCRLTKNEAAPYTVRYNLQSLTDPNAYTEVGSVGGDTLSWGAYVDVNSYLDLSGELATALAGSTHANTTWTVGSTTSATELPVAKDGSLVIDLYYTRNKHDLTVRYWYGTNENDRTQVPEALAPTFTGTYAFGAAYEVTSRAITGYTASPRKVEGAMPDEDLVYDVYYTRNSYTLTIRYLYAATGTQASPTYEATVAYGVDYNEASPAIAGYTASPARVTGTMPDGNVEVTVFYTAIPTPPPPPDDEGVVVVAAAPALVNINAYGVPLGFANTVMNLGDCFE